VKGEEALMSSRVEFDVPWVGQLESVLGGCTTELQKVGGWTGELP